MGQNYIVQLVPLHYEEGFYRDDLQPWSDCTVACRS